MYAQCANRIHHNDKAYKSFFYESPKMKKLITLTVMTLILAGCNTIAGVGKDVQKVGQAVEGAGRK
jgi:entericidin A